MPMSIPLPILIGIISVGFLTLFVLLTAMGNHRRAALSAAAARDRLRLDFPDLDIQTVTLSDDRQVALAPIGGGDAVGVVVVSGDRFATRVLAPGDLRRVSASAEGLRLRLRDPGFPHIQLAMADPDARDRWKARFAGEAQAGGAHEHP